MGHRNAKEEEKTRILERRSEASRAQDERAIKMETERQSSKQKRMEELEVTALSSLTLMGPQTHTHCLGHNSAKPLSHRKRAAKPDRALSGAEGALAHRG